MSVCVRCKDFPAYEQEEADGTTDGKKYCAVCWENRHTIRANDRADRAEALLCEALDLQYGPLHWRVRARALLEHKS